MTIHKADYKNKYEKMDKYKRIKESPSPMCVGILGIYMGNSYELTKNWKNVTCKHCLKRKPVDRRHGITYMKYWW